MREQYSGSQVAVTHCITDETATEDKILVAREIGDLSVVGPPLCIAKTDSSGNLILDRGVDVFESSMNDSSTLARDIILEPLFKSSDGELTKLHLPIAPHHNL